MSAVRSCLRSGHVCSAMLGFATAAALDTPRLRRASAKSLAAWPHRIFRRPRVAYSRYSPWMMLPKPDSKDLKQWEDLIHEFESRSVASQDSQVGNARPGGRSGEPDVALSRSFPERPKGRPLGRENPAQYETLNTVEAAAMTAATAVLWFLGRILQLDSFLILIYPFPSLFIMMRWGPPYGNMMFFTTCLLILTLMGPLYGLSFTLNSGLLALALGNAMWYQWHWVLAIFAGCFAKFVGLIVNVTWTSALLRYNTWKLVGEQVKGMIDQVGTLACRVLANGAVFQGPTKSQVQLGVAILVALHSLFHVLLTHMATSMVLDRLYNQGSMARSPPLVPWLSFLKRIAGKQYDEMRADPFAPRKSGDADDVGDGPSY